MSDLAVMEKLANWQRLKALVLDSVSSPLTRRVYNMALDDFIAWLQERQHRDFCPNVTWLPACAYRDPIFLLKQRAVLKHHTTGPDLPPCAGVWVSAHA
jgi:hypothetical protein